MSAAIEGCRVARSPGRTRKSLAKRLQSFLPDYEGHSVTWLPERIHAVQGFYRSSPLCESYRWEASGIRTADGMPWCFVSSFATMTKLLMSDNWTFDGGEIDCLTVQANDPVQDVANAPVVRKTAC